MFVRKYVVPVLALIGVGYAVFTVLGQSRPVSPAPPVNPPATSPFSSAVAGAGIVEASSENIVIGSHRGGIVATLPVKVGDRVRRGDVLFTLDDRAARAEVAVREAALASARNALERLRLQPRAEDVPPAEARVAQAKTAVEDLKDSLRRVEEAGEAGGATMDELMRRRFAAATAQQRLAEAEAELAKLRAGAWGPDVAVAESEVRAAEAMLESARTELELLTVRAPIDGEVLQVNVRVGEPAPAGETVEPLVVMGATDVLHVRVDIDENDAWRVKPSTRAVASLRGNASMRTELTFVRVEPLVVPKRSLTGSSSERIDTRVLQVVYSFPRERLPVYVGQLMDVYVEEGE